MKTTILSLIFIVILPFAGITQTAREWIDQAETAEERAQELEAQGRDAEAQNAWREAATARANAAEKQVENEDYEDAAENYKKAAEQFRKAGNEAQADAEATKAASNYENAADEAQANGDEEEAERLREKAKDVKPQQDIAEPVTESKAAAERAFDAVVTRARGTGRTTGHIATVSVKNNGDEAIVTREQIFYIPSDGRYQSYVGRIPNGIEIPPGATVDIPVNGYCTDVHTPPVSSGEPMVPVDSWIPVQTGTLVSGEASPHAVRILPKPPVSGFSPDDIPDIRNTPGFSATVQWKESELDFHPVYPTTGIPIDGTIDIDENPEVFGPLVVSIVEEIEGATEIIQDDTGFATPFAGNPEKEYESIVQQTVWITLGVLKGDVYDKEDFRENVYEQYETSTGMPVSALEENDKDKVNAGVDDFWNTFMATGVEAKVLKGNPGQDAVPISHRHGCQCDSISVELLIRKGDDQEGVKLSSTDLDNSEIVSHRSRFNVNDGDSLTVIISSVNLFCSCTEATEGSDCNTVYRKKRLGRLLARERGSLNVSFGSDTGDNDNNNIDYTLVEIYERYGLRVVNEGSTNKRTYQRFTVSGYCTDAVCGGRSEEANDSFCSKMFGINFNSL